ncbi:MAG: SLATT domain-containing protein [Flavobacteriales bacterium]
MPITAPNTLEALRKLKVDCLYTKSSHFNAARRLKTGGDRFRVALIFGTIAASFSTIMNVGIWDKIPGDTILLQVVVNVMGAFGGFLILYTTTFSDYKSKIEVANKHDNIATDLNLIYKLVRNTEANYLDGVLNDTQLIASLDQLTQDYITKCANAPLTTDEDFKKARDNFNDGYTANYTDEELNC